LKPASPSKLVVLRVWEEAIGILVDVDLSQGFLGFEGFHLQVEPEALRKVSDLMIGYPVQVLRTDIRETPFLVTCAPRGRFRSQREKPSDLPLDETPAELRHQTDSQNLSFRKGNRHKLAMQNWSQAYDKDVSQIRAPMRGEEFQ